MITKLLPSVNRYPRSLIYVTTRDHGYTVGNYGALLAEHGVGLKVHSYDGLFRRKTLPLTTYILTDFDRLSSTELEAAAAVRARLIDAGAPVLNDPRHYRPRPQMLHHLRQAGLNPLHAWEPAAGQWPDRYPVLLRTIAAHRGPIGDLIHNRQQAQRRLERAIENGHPISNLTFIEFAGEDIPGQGFRKYAAFRIGGRIIRANTVTDAGWIAKQGQVGLTSDAFYAQEREETVQYPREAHMRAIFDALGHDFGRIDYGLIGGKPVIYEINSNPQMHVRLDHPNPDRSITLRTMQNGIVEALAAVSSPRNPRIVSLHGVFRLPNRSLIRRPRRF